MVQQNTIAPKKFCVQIYVAKSTTVLWEKLFSYHNRTVGLSLSLRNDRFKCINFENWWIQYVFSFQFYKVHYAFPKNRQVQRNLLNLYQRQPGTHSSERFWQKSSMEKNHITISTYTFVCPYFCTNITLERFITLLD